MKAVVLNDRNSRRKREEILGFHFQLSQEVKKLREPSKEAVDCGLPTTRELVEAGLINEGTVLMQEITRS